MIYAFTNLLHFVLKLVLTAIVKSCKTVIILISIINLQRHWMKTRKTWWCFWATHSFPFFFGQLSSSFFVYTTIPYIYNWYIWKTEIDDEVFVLLIMFRTHCRDLTKSFRFKLYCGQSENIQQKNSLLQCYFLAFLPIDIQNLRKMEFMNLRVGEVFVVALSEIKVI